MLQVIVDCTNIYINSIMIEFLRLRDAKNTDGIQFKALIGHGMTLLYLLCCFKQHITNKADK